MELPEIYSATLGLFPPWHVTSVKVATEENRLDIAIDFFNEGLFACPGCGARCRSCHSAFETWHHEDFFYYKTYLHARVPQIHCASCGITTAERPWSRPGSRFSLAVES